MLPAKKSYRFRTENLRSLETAQDCVRTQLRASIREQRGDMETFQRFYILLIGITTECRLKKLLAYPDKFSSAELTEIEKIDTQCGRWKKTVELAFRKHYSIPNAPLADHLPHSASARRATLESLLDNELAAIIELRNKLAHGEWIYPFTSDGDKTSEKHFAAIKKENILTLGFKNQMLIHICQLVHDLVVSKPTFERDFDKLYSRIIQAKVNVAKRSFENYLRTLRSKHQRGLEKRSVALRLSNSP